MPERRREQWGLVHKTPHSRQEQAPELQVGDAPSLVTWATTHCTHEGVQMLEPGRRGGPSQHRNAVQSGSAHGGGSGALMGSTAPHRRP